MLKVDRIRFGYGAEAVLDGVGIEVGRGELVGLVGPNGSGKTTLLRVISGVLAVSAGRVSVDGQDLAGLRPSSRARLVSVVPQNPQLPGGFTVRELVLMARNSHLTLLEWEGRGDVEAATRAMMETSTLELADRALGTVSGGERQLAVVAMAKRPKRSSRRATRRSKRPRLLPMERIPSRKIAITKTKTPPKRVTLKMSPTRKAMPQKVQNSKTSDQKLS